MTSNKYNNGSSSSDWIHDVSSNSKNKRTEVSCYSENDVFRVRFRLYIQAGSVTLREKDGNEYHPLNVSGH